MIEVGGTPLEGTQIVVSNNVPDKGGIMYGFDMGAIRTNQAATMAFTIFCGPLTYWRLLHPGRDPFLSKYNPGSRALRRDRRRRR